MSLTGRRRGGSGLDYQRLPVAQDALVIEVSVDDVPRLKVENRRGRGHRVGDRPGPRDPVLAGLDRALRPAQGGLAEHGGYLRLVAMANEGL